MVSPILVLSGAVLGMTLSCITRAIGLTGTDIQDAVWESYLDNGGNPDNDGDWVAWVIANAVNYLDDIIWLTESE